MADSMLTRLTIQRDGAEIALEPYENDRWDLTFNGRVVHSFEAEKLDLKVIANLLVEKGHLEPKAILGMTRLADWKSFDVLPLPEDK